MAAFSLGHTLHAKHCTPFHKNKLSSRTNASLSCRSHLSAGPSGSGGKKREHKVEREEEKKRWSLVELFGEAEKLARGLKERLSPKQKGDWKDLVLMGFTFAVCIYISQKIVCAFCAWVSMPKSF